MRVRWYLVGLLFPLLGARDGVALGAESAARDVIEEGRSDDYSGTYVLLQQTATIAEIPVLADVIAIARAVSLQNLAHRGSRLQGTGKVCHLQVETSSSLAQTEIPAAFRRSLPDVRTDAEVTYKDGTVSFRQAPQTLVVGAKLKAGEPLPIEPRDPRVFDQDLDEKPGVTVRVSGLISGDIYLVQRSTSRLYGSLRGAAFTGRIDFQNEQSVLGTTNRLFGSGPDPRPIPARSYFRLERVSDHSTCEDATRLAAGWR